MAEQWISAAKALEIAKDSFALCERLYAGMILARASVLLTGDKREEKCAIPRGFWWAMGHAALDQNWNVCDFSTWLEQKQHIQAYGVTMGLSGVLETVDFEKRALIARSLSVASNPDWISASEASRLSGQTTKPVNAGEPILALARLGFVSGIREIFRGAFEAAGLPYFNPHSFRDTLVQHGERICPTIEAFKAWSQNLGHERVMTTLTSYGTVAPHRQAELIRGMAADKPR